MCGKSEENLTSTTLHVKERSRRLDIWLARQLPHLTRSRITQLIRQGHVLLNSSKTKSAQSISPGDTVTVRIPKPEPPACPAPQAIPLDILYEDEHLVAINKPSGLVVHPGAGNYQGTIVSALLHHYKNQLSSIGGMLRPGIVHRLDKYTSGVLLVARNDTAHHVLCRLFSSRSVEKHYIALCGKAPKFDCGKWDFPITRHPTERKKMTISQQGRTAITLFRTLEKKEDVALLHLQILTGRTHQIRVHATHAGCPILGDPLYGRQGSKAPRTMLHAACIRLPHPVHKTTLEIYAQIPDDFLQLMQLYKFTISAKKIFSLLHKLNE